MTRCVQSTDFDVVANVECGIVAGCAGDMSAVLAADDWDLVLFELVMNELSSDESSDYVSLGELPLEMDELCLGFRQRDRRGCAWDVSLDEVVAIAGNLTDVC